MIDQENDFKLQVNSLQEAVNKSEEKQEEMKRQIDNLQAQLSISSSQNEALKAENERLSKFESDVVELKEKVHQQSGNSFITGCCSG